MHSTHWMSDEDCCKIFAGGGNKHSTDRIDRRRMVYLSNDPTHLRDLKKINNDNNNNNNNNNNKMIMMMIIIIDRFIDGYINS